MRLLSLTATFATALLPVFAHADAVEDALKARQGYMKMLALNMGTLSGMAKGEIAYDEAAAAKAGSNIEALTNYTVADLFIEGTAAGEVESSEALPAIWENPDKFARQFAALSEAAAGAGEAVKGGQENVGPALQKLGGACKECHDSFREK